jgi:hypothetical protein
MKTSRIILITIGIILLAMWTTILFIARKDIKTIMATQSRVEYRPVPVDKFNRLDFSSHWIVRIKQGKDCELELGMEESDNGQPEMNISEGTLYLSHNRSIHARITAPVLQVIRAEGNTEITMKNYWTDSIRVILGDSSSFTGSQNDFKYISFQAEK